MRGNALVSAEPAENRRGGIAFGRNKVQRGRCTGGDDAGEGRH